MCDCALWKAWWKIIGTLHWTCIIPGGSFPKKGANNYGVDTAQGWGIRKTVALILKAMSFFKKNKKCSFVMLKKKRLDQKYWRPLRSQELLHFWLLSRRVPILLELTPCKRYFEFGHTIGRLCSPILLRHTFKVHNFARLIEKKNCPSKVLAPHCSAFTHFHEGRQ